MKKHSKANNDNFFTIAEENDALSSGITAPHTLTPEEVLGTKSSKKIIEESHNALDTLKKRMRASHIKADGELPNGFSFSNEEKTEAPKNPPLPNEENKSLLDKCMPFLVEDDGTKATINNEPLYKLQSVADILKSDSEKVLEKLSENYDILFEDFENASSAEEEKLLTNFRRCPLKDRPILLSMTKHFVDELLNR